MPSRGKGHKTGDASGQAQGCKATAGRGARSSQRRPAQAPAAARGDLQRPQGNNVQLSGDGATPAVTFRDLRTPAPSRPAAHPELRDGVGQLHVRRTRQPSALSYLGRPQRRAAGPSQAAGGGRWSSEGTTEHALGQRLIRVEEQHVQGQPSPTRCSFSAAGSPFSGASGSSTRRDPRGGCWERSHAPAQGPASLRAGRPRGLCIAALGAPSAQPEERLCPPALLGGFPEAGAQLWVCRRRKSRLWAAARPRPVMSKRKVTRSRRGRPEARERRRGARPVLATVSQVLRGNGVSWKMLPSSPDLEVVPPLRSFSHIL